LPWERAAPSSRTSDGGAPGRLSPAARHACLGLKRGEAGARTIVGTWEPSCGPRMGRHLDATVSNDTSNNLLAVFFTDSSTGTVVGEAGTILRTRNGGVTWTSQSSGVTNWLRGVSFQNADDGIRGGRCWHNPADH
jgi:hypothetical protein